MESDPGRLRHESRSSGKWFALRAARYAKRMFWTRAAGRHSFPPMEPPRTNCWRRRITACISLRRSRSRGWCGSISGRLGLRRKTQRAGRGPYLYNHFMPQIDKHAPGTFCWVELATTDQDAAKHFYGSLFGWSIVDYPMGPGDFYTMFQSGGRDAAAGYTMRAEERSQGVPPHWNLYVAVEDADATAARAVELGG